MHVPSVVVDMSSASLEEDHFEYYDVIILGTSLTQSILAAAFSTAGLKVLQLDSYGYYGRLFSAATLSADNVAALEGYRSLFDVFDMDTLSSLRQLDQQKCHIDFMAVPFYARDPMISLLIDSGLATYIDFKLVSHFSLYSPSYGFFKIPLSKEDIFLHDRLSLLEKRKLMKMLQAIDKTEPDLPLIEWMAGFQVPDYVRDIFCFGLAKYTNEDQVQTATVHELKRRSSLTLHSLGVYGASPLLLPNYGASELPQGFSRRSSVMGGSVMLGSSCRSITLVSSDDDNQTWYQVETDNGMKFRSKYMIDDANHANHLLLDAHLEEGAETVHRLILVTRTSICPSIDGLAYMILVPSELTQRRTVHVLQTNAETFACPLGYYVLHFYVLDARSEHGCKELLSPLIDAFFPCDKEKLDESQQPVLFRLYTSKKMKRAKTRDGDSCEHGTASHEKSLFICQERVEPTSAEDDDHGGGETCFQKCILEAQSIYCQVLNVPKKTVVLFPTQKAPHRDSDEDLLA